MALQVSWIDIDDTFDIISGGRAGQAGGVLIKDSQTASLRAGGHMALGCLGLELSGVVEETVLVWAAVAA